VDGAATLLIVDRWFLPVFLRNDINTMPQFCSPDSSSAPVDMTVI
jgi:hypothetical protein